MLGINKVIIFFVLLIIDRVEHSIGRQTNYLVSSLICCSRICYANAYACKLIYKILQTLHSFKIIGN